MYKVTKPYKQGHMMNLNLMGIEQTRRIGLSGYELLFILVPLALCILGVISLFKPELGFLAECQNIPGGDLCSISLK